MNEIVSAASSRGVTPEAQSSPSTPPSGPTVAALRNISCHETIRLLEIYQFEIASVHPIVDTKQLMRNAPRLLEYSQQPPHAGRNIQPLEHRDKHMMQIAMATAMLLERHGKNEHSDSLIQSVEAELGVISLASKVELKDIQIMGMLVRPPKYHIVFSMLTIFKEPLLLPYGRGAICVARHWPCSSAMLGNGSPLQAKLDGQFRRRERTGGRDPDILGSVRARPQMELRH
jgi:hypothetical protein